MAKILSNTDGGLFTADNSAVVFIDYQPQRPYGDAYRCSQAAELRISRTRPMMKLITAFRLILATRFNITLFLILIVAITGCATGPPIETVDSVNIERFMGDWYVIANIPHAIEKDAYNAVESYRLAEDGTIETTLTFNKGGFDGPLKTYKPRGFIHDRESNAVWGMQFFWPFKAEYRIIYLNENYTQTVIGRTKRDYVWVMAREPFIADDDYDRILDFIGSQGYNLSKLQKVPQQAR